MSQNYPKIIPRIKNPHREVAQIMLEGNEVIESGQASIAGRLDMQQLTMQRGLSFQRALPWNLAGNIDNYSA
jgi:hypothetical protein